jgi:predicted DNA-binding protein YlxM (UPF0122 family)
MYIDKTAGLLYNCKALCFTALSGGIAMAMKNLKISLLLDFYGAILTDKQRESLELYYNEDLSLAEIAEIAQISRQGVRDNIKRGESILLEMEEKLGFFEKYSDLDEVMEQLTNLAENIKDVNSIHFKSREVLDFCNDIITITKGCRARGEVDGI